MIVQKDQIHFVLLAEEIAHQRRQFDGGDLCFSRAGVLLSAFVLTAFGLGLSWHGTDEGGLRKAGTIAFMMLALAQTFHVFNSRSQTESNFTKRLFTNA